LIEKMARVAVENEVPGWLWPVKTVFLREANDFPAQDQVSFVL